MQNVSGSMSLSIKVAKDVMNELMGEGVAYHSGVIGLVMDLEGHFLEDESEILSSVEQAILYMQTDVRFEGQLLGLTYEIGKRVFHYWAERHHQDDYTKLRVEVCRYAGISEDVRQIVEELRVLMKSSNLPTFH